MSGARAARSAHYTALLAAIDVDKPMRLSTQERGQLVEAADALLFGEHEREALLRSAQELIETLESSQRWSAEECDQLREHLYGCDSSAAPL